MENKFVLRSFLLCYVASMLSFLLQKHFIKSYGLLHFVTEHRKKCSARCARGGHRVAPTDLGSHSQHGSTPGRKRPIRVRRRLHNVTTLAM